MDKPIKNRSNPTEAALWARIRNKLDCDGDRAYRIEAINTPGFPDVIWFPYKKFPVLIELKAGPLKFRPVQIKFIRDIDALGTTVWLIWQQHIRAEVGVWRAVRMLDDPREVIGELLENWMERMRKT